MKNAGKACNNRLYRHIRTFEKIVKNYFVIYAENGYVNDINKDRLHHEIYMSDARKVAPEKWKTVIRHPIKKA